MASIFIRDDLADKYAHNSGHKHYIDVPDGDGHSIRHYFQSFWRARICQKMHEDDGTFLRIKNIVIYN